MDTNGFSPRLLVVIHAQHKARRVSPIEHVMNSAQTAYYNGADGVFLIPDYENERSGYNLRATSEDLFTYYFELKKEFPDLLVGVNFLKKFEYLGVDLIAQIKKANFNLLQSDGSFKNVLPFEEMSATEFFTGLAFKYSKAEKLMGDALRLACEKIPNLPNVIPTTSGPATGHAASLEKIREIRKYLPSESRLGIASGISVFNVESFLTAGVTDFLVATSLIRENEQGFDILDGKKIKELACKIKEF